MLLNKNIKIFVKMILGFILLLQFIGIPTQEALAVGKELTGVVKSVEVLDSTDTKVIEDSEGIYQLRTAQLYKFRALFDLTAYDGNLNNDDYFIFDLPAPLDITETVVQLIEPTTGINIGEAVVVKTGLNAGGKVTVTLKNLEEYLKVTGGDIVRDVSGSLGALFKINSNVIKETITFDSKSMETTIIKNITTITNTPIPLQGYENFAKAGGVAQQISWNSALLNSIGSKSSGNFLSRWRVRLNTGGQNYGPNLVLIDTLPTSLDYAAIQYIPESLKVYEAPTMTESSSGQGSDARMLQEGIEYSVVWNANYTQSTITLKDGSKKYFIIYDTTTPNDGSTVGNTVSVMTETGTQLTQRSNNTNTTTTAEATSLYSGTIISSIAYKIKIIKTDSFSLIPVAGAVYEVTTPDGITQEIVTDEKGVATTTMYNDDIASGIFKIVEKTSPPGYVRDEEVHLVKLPGEGKIVNLQNDPIPVSIDITATKRLEGREMLADEFTFKLFDYKGREIDEVSNDKSGLIKFKDLKFKGIGKYNYFIQEVRGNLPNIEYDLTRYPIVVNVTKENSVLKAEVISAPIHVINKYIPPVGKIELTKTDGTQPLSGAEFDVLDLNGTVVDHLVTADGGIATTKELPLGDYKLVETKAPKGYVRDATPLVVEITENNQVVKVSKVNNQAMGKIELTKTDGTQPLSGAEFDVLDLNGTVVDHLVTADGGIATTKELPLGNYKLVETKAPKGYVRDATPLVVEITENNQIVKVSKVNKQAMGKIELTKTDGTQPLSGAEFDVLDLNGTVVDHLVTADGGNATTKELPLGDYKLVETKAPKGYVQDATPLVVEITENNQVVKVSKVNKQAMGKIELTKTDGTQPLSGAEFDVLDLNGTVVDHLVTADGGIAATKELPLGDYKLVETKAPKGYVQDATPLVVEITENNQVVKVSKVNNQAMGKIELTKTDGTQPLSGAEFDVLDINGTVVDHLVTADGGNATTKELPLGDYKLVETKAPKGYVQDATPLVVEITENNQVVKVSKVNKQAMGTVIVSKYDLETRNRLSGMVFRIKNIENGMEKTIEMKENNVIEIKSLPLGTYQISEVFAPSGYEINLEIQTFTIEKNGDIKTIDIYDLRKEIKPNPPAIDERRAIVELPHTGNSIDKIEFHTKLVLIFICFPLFILGFNSLLKKDKRKINSKNLY